MAEHFFIIGAQRSGSTYLYNVLDAHHAVFMAKPVRPEPKYFLGPDSAAAGYSTYRQTYFEQAGEASWLGEKSTSYIERVDAAQRIAQTIPDARILVILRDPVERAISNYHFTRGYGLEPLDFESALAEEVRRLDEGLVENVSVSPYAYCQRGRYVDYLERWAGLFDVDRMAVLVAESFIGNASAIAALYRWLGVDDRMLPADITTPVNAGRREGAPAIADNVRNRLAAEFRPWNERLAERFGLDLSSWRGMS